VGPVAARAFDGGVWVMIDKLEEPIASHSPERSWRELNAHLRVAVQVRRLRPRPAVFGQRHQPIAFVCSCAIPAGAPEGVAVLAAIGHAVWTDGGRTNAGRSGGNRHGHRPRNPATRM
jgi:hypothetical protein